MALNNICRLQYLILKPLYPYTNSLGSTPCIVQIQNQLRESDIRLIKAFFFVISPSILITSSLERVKNPRYNIHCFDENKLMRTIHISMTSTFECEYCQCFTFKRCDKFKLKCTSHGVMYSAHYFAKISKLTLSHLPS